MTIEAEAPRAAAPAKINLFLHVGDRRPDGYHALQSLVAFARVGDQLAFAPDRNIELAVGGPFAKDVPAGAGNLIAKAAKALAAYAGIERGARIALTKNLPVSSGIGGGSADAAAALRGLSRLWRLNFSADELCKIAEPLGSDVPVCIACGPQWMEGRGERLTRLDALPALPAVLVNPGVAVPTAGVFAALDERRGVGMPLPPKMSSSDELIAYLVGTGNDLEAPARALAPAIGDALAALSLQTGRRLVRMSGSGATCFGIFDSDAAAARAALAIGERYRRWWTVATTIAPAGAAVS